MKTIHEFKFCPHCKTPLEYRHVFDRDRQQCPHCGWVYFLGPKVGAGAIVERDDKVILVKRGVEPGKGLWCFPSGFMEYDETPQHAATREFKEETGLDIAITGLVDVYYYDSDFRGAGILVLYQGELVGGTPAPMDDVIEVRFFGADELPLDEIAFRSNRVVLAQWQQDKLKAKV